MPDSAPYYLLIDNNQAGPYTLGDVTKLLQSGRISGETPIWYEGLSQWVGVNSLIGPPPFVPPVNAPPLAPPQSPAARDPRSIQNPALIAGVGAVVFWVILVPTCLSNLGDVSVPETRSVSVGQSFKPPTPRVPDLPAAPVSSSSAYPALDEKNGFREYVLGRSISNFNPTDLGVPLVVGDEHRYMLTNFDKKIGICQITNLRLDFNQDYLTGIVVCVDGEQNIEALKQAFIAAYGQPQKGVTVYPSYVWSGSNVTLNFQTDRDIITGAPSGMACFSSRSITAQVQAIVERKAQGAAEQAAKHL